MRRFAAVVAIGLGVLFSCALGCSPPVEADQQAGPAAKDRPPRTPPLPSGERAGLRGGEQVGLALSSRESGKEEENELIESASSSSPDPEDRETETEDDAPLIDPMSANAACYVCHMTFIREEFSQVHLKEKITCIECHGVSGPHANDENIGATPPDITFERGEVDASCAECHDEHDVPAREIIARSLERQLPDSSPICTDCHGTHKIEQAEEEAEEDAEKAKEEGGTGPGKSTAAGLPEARSRAVSVQTY